jgi:hypothetical protein
MRKAFTCLALLSLFAIPALAQDFMLVGPASGCLLEDNTVEFTLTAGDEAVTDFGLVWPGCVSVMDGMAGGFAFEANQSEARFTGGTLPAGEQLTVVVTVYLGEGCIPTTQTVRWATNGFDYDVGGQLSWPVDECVGPSWELLGPPYGCITENNEVLLNLTAGDQDVMNFSLLWPGCVDVIEGSADGFAFEANGSEARFTGGVLPAGQTLSVYVGVYLTDVCIPTTQIINWSTNGFDYDMGGQFEWPVQDCPTPIEQTTWTQVKALYN